MMEIPHSNASYGAVSWNGLTGRLGALVSGERARRAKRPGATPDSAAHFISYPKSGRSWVRYILHNLDAEGRIAFHHDGFEFNDGARPAHDYDIEKRLTLYGGIKIVYLHRDPRDVLVSLYFQITGRFKNKFRYRGSISDFIRDPYFGAEPLRRFSLVWRYVAAELPVFTTSYEEMSADTYGQTLRLLDYLEIARSPERVRMAIETASLDNMRELERSGSFSEPWLRLLNGHPKVREGKIGGHREALTQADIDYLNHAFREVLSSLPEKSR